MYSLFWILWFIMQLQAQFKASLGEYPQENRILVPESTHRWKDRAIAYLWIVTCKDADCEMDQWSKRIDYNKYTKHYNKEYTINDSVKVCTKYAKALKSEIYDKKANVNNDADQKEDGM
eukprot:65221_1